MNVNDDKDYVNELGMTYEGRKRIHNRVVLAAQDFGNLRGRLIERREGAKNVTNPQARIQLENKLRVVFDALVDLQKDVDFGWGWNEQRH